MLGLLGVRTALPFTTAHPPGTVVSPRGIHTGMGGCCPPDSREPRDSTDLPVDRLVPVSRAHGTLAASGS